MCHNLLATIARRPEAYHRKILAGNDGAGRPVRQHPRPRGVQAGQSRPAACNTTTISARACWIISIPRKPPWTPWPAARPPRRGDFLGGVYEARIRRNPGRMQVQMVREGNARRRAAADHQGRDAQRRQFDAGDRLSAGGLPPDRPLHFAVEFNFAGLPAGAEDRYFLSDGHRAWANWAPAWTCPRPAAWNWSTSGWESTWP